MMNRINEELKLNNKIKTDFIKFLSGIFDRHEGDHYFPWSDIDRYLIAYGESNNSEFIKTNIKKIQDELINEFDNINIHNPTPQKYINDLFKKYFGDDCFN